MVGTTTSLYATGYMQPVQRKGLGLSDARSAGLIRTFAYRVAGTMGLLTPKTVDAAYTTSVAPVQYQAYSAQIAAHQADELERTAADNLARIREVLNPTMLELANLFGVSRQAVYAWQAGAQPAPQAAERLARLARAAEVFHKAGLPVDARTLRRKVAGGVTLLETVLSGADAERAAQSLLATLQREAAQRARLQAQLAGRKRTPADPLDYASPAMPHDD